MRKKTQTHHQIFKILLQKLIEDGQYDAEDLFVLVQLAQEWKLDIGEQCNKAGISMTVFDPSCGVRPIGPAPGMTEGNEHASDSPSIPPIGSSNL